VPLFSFRSRETEQTEQQWPWAMMMMIKLTDVVCRNSNYY
jgi:hypothetical protein